MVYEVNQKGLLQQCRKLILQAFERITIDQICIYCPLEYSRASKRMKHFSVLLYIFLGV